MSMNTMAMLASVVTRASEGAWLDLGDHRGRTVVASAQSNGTVLMAEVEVDFLGGVPPHIHSREDEIFHVLSGEFEITIGDTTVCATSGDTVFAPRDVIHTWRCVSEEGGRMIGFITPGANFEAFITQVSAQKIAPADPAGLEKMLALSAQHGITMLPTPQH